MNLFETAFAYVQRALHGRGLPELLDQPRSTLVHRHATPEATPEATTGPVGPGDLDGGPVAVSLLAPTEVLVMDGEEQAGQNEFADLLAGIGAVATPPQELSALDRKEREIAELQRNLEMLRPIGDELARVEQLRLAERADFEAERARFRKAPSAPAGHETQVAPAGLRDVTRLLSALDSTLSNALTGVEAPTVTPEPAQTGSAQRLERTVEQLASARERLAEQKQKTAKRREEAQALRVRVRELEKQHRALAAERKKLHAPVRELARRAKLRTKPLSRLIELLGLEID